MNARIYLSANGFFLKGDDLLSAIKSTDAPQPFSMMDAQTFNTVGNSGHFHRPVIFDKGATSTTLRIHRLATDILDYQNNGAVLIQSRDLLLACIRCGIIDKLTVIFANEFDYPRSTGSYSSKEFPFYDNNYRWRRKRAITNAEGQVKKGVYVHEWCGEKKAPRVTKKEIQKILGKLVI